MLLFLYCLQQLGISTTPYRVEELVARGHAAVLQGVVVGGQAVLGVLLRGRTFLSYCLRIIYDDTEIALHRPSFSLIIIKEG